NRARIPADPPTPTPAARTKPPPLLSYSKYWLSRSCSKSSHQIHPACGVPHSPAAEPAVTVTADVPLFPSLVAVIVADPAVTPRTRPLLFTVATLVLPLCQVTGRPLNRLPLASLGVAVNCTVCPTVTLGVAGLTATDATATVATVTVTVAAPLFPSLVAVIAADPAVTPLTAPPPLTVATP